MPTAPATRARLAEGGRGPLLDRVTEPVPVPTLPREAVVDTEPKMPGLLAHGSSDRPSGASTNRVSAAAVAGSGSGSSCADQVGPVGFGADDGSGVGGVGHGAVGVGGDADVGDVGG